MKPMTENDIAEYLIQNPEFFERHAELLASVRLYGGHGTRASSLQERQATLLREKIKHHEQRLMEMIRYGNENEALANRLHRWTCEILAVSNPLDLPALVLTGLQSHFFIPQASMRLWQVKPEFSSAEFSLPASTEIRQLASSLDQPYMGVNPESDLLSWFNEPDQVQSVALIPLKNQDQGICFGLLAFASPDSHRFNATMGVDFLERIGSLCVATLSRLTTLDPT